MEDFITKDISLQHSQKIIVNTGWSIEAGSDEAIQHAEETKSEEQKRILDESCFLNPNETEIFSIKLKAKD